MPALAQPREAALGALRHQGAHITIAARTRVSRDHARARAAGRPAASLAAAAVDDAGSISPLPAE